MQNYFAATGDKTKSVVVSTASPYKFCNSVLDAIGTAYAADDDLIEVLERATNVPAPRSLTELKYAKERFTDVLDAAEMADSVLEFAAAK
jgi:threonine synthase